MNEVESTEQLVHKHLLVSGTVQGVWYRQSTMEQAQALGLHGWVRNLPDGRVEIQVHGPQAIVQQFITWCHQGPPLAQVSKVQVQDVDTPDSLPQGFHITR